MENTTNTNTNTNNKGENTMENTTNLINKIKEREASLLNTTIQDESESLLNTIITRDIPDGIYEVNIIDYKEDLTTTGKRYLAINMEIPELDNTPITSKLWDKSQVTNAMYHIRKQLNDTAQYDFPTLIKQAQQTTIFITVKRNITETKTYRNIYFGIVKDQPKEQDTIKPLEI